MENIKELDISQIIFNNIVEDDYYNIKNHILLKYYEMFKEIPNNAKIYVRSDKDKEQVKIIGNGVLENKNIIINI